MVSNIIMNRLLVTINGTPDSIWQGFTEVCKVFDLPYHNLKDKPFPRRHNEIVIYKLPFRCRGQENE